MKRLMIFLPYDLEMCRDRGFRPFSQIWDRDLTVTANLINRIFVIWQMARLNLKTLIDFRDHHLRMSMSFVAKIKLDHMHC